VVKAFLSSIHTAHLSKSSPILQQEPRTGRSAALSKTKVMRSSNVILAAIAIAVALAGSSCSTNAAGGEVVDRAHTPYITETDPELNSALALIDKAPDSKMAYNNLAVLYIKRARNSGDFGLYLKAEAAIEKALKVDPADGSTRKLQASLSLTFHRFSEALERGTALDREFPNDAFIKGVLTDAHIELGNYDEAVAAAQQMVDLRPNSLSYARVAQLRSLYGDHKGSVEMYKLATRTADPADPEAKSWCLVRLGDEYFKNGNLDAAERSYDEALSLMPQYHMALAGKGRVRAALGDLEGAEKILSELVTRIPLPETAAQLGNIYMLQGDAERAKAQYDLVEVIEQKLGPNTDQKRLAILWADRDERLPEALAIAEKQNALANDLNTADLFAWTLYKNGRLVEAREAGKRAMRLKGADAKIIYHAGMIEKGLGNKTQATKLLSTALKLNPEFDLIQSQKAKAALAELKETR